MGPRWPTTFSTRISRRQPYWWEAYKPVTGDLVDVPKTARVAIVGGGYAGLSCAIELADAGIEACVFESAELGAGASTRSGGGVSGGVNIGKSFTGKVTQLEPDVLQNILASGYDAFSLIESLIEREKIDCYWEKTGRFVGAWTPKDYAYQERRVATLNANAGSGAFMVPRERQREEMASDYYYGGMVVERSAKVHPALYYKGLLDAARRRNITLCAKAAVKTITPVGKGWRIATSRGDIEVGDVVIATNGYTGDATPELKRRLIPLASHIIATEELPGDLARTLIPKGRTLADTKRVLCYYRMSPDNKRMIFGGRARFTQVDAGRERADPASLHDRSLSAVEGHPRHPCLDRQCRLHLGCAAAHRHARRHALCARLQRQRRGDDDLSRTPDRAAHHRRRQFHLRLRAGGVSGFPALQRQSELGAARHRRLLPFSRWLEPDAGAVRLSDSGRLPCEADVPLDLALSQRWEAQFLLCMGLFSTFWARGPAMDRVLSSSMLRSPAGRPPSPWT